MYLDLGDCSDKWLYGCLFLVHNKAYLRAVFILIWDQTIVCWWAWPSFFFSPDVNFYFFNSTCLLPPIHLPHASMLWSCDTMDCSPPGSFVRGIFQARILEWVAISFFLGLPFLTGDPLPLKRITVSEILVVRIQRGNICLPRWEPVIFCSSLHTWDPTSRVLWREKGLYL